MIVGEGLTIALEMIRENAVAVAGLSSMVAALTEVKEKEGGK